MSNEAWQRSLNLPDTYKVSRISMACADASCYSAWSLHEESQVHTQKPSKDKALLFQLLKRSNVLSKQHLDDQEDAWLATHGSCTSCLEEPSL